MYACVITSALFVLVLLAVFVVTFAVGPIVKAASLGPVTLTHPTLTFSTAFALGAVVFPALRFQCSLVLLAQAALTPLPKESRIAAVMVVNRRLSHITCVG